MKKWILSCLTNAIAAFLRLVLTLTDWLNCNQKLLQTVDWTFKLFFLSFFLFLFLSFFHLKKKEKTFLRLKCKSVGIWIPSFVTIEKKQRCLSMSSNRLRLRLEYSNSNFELVWSLNGLRLGLEFLGSNFELALNHLKNYKPWWGSTMKMTTIHKSFQYEGSKCSQILFQMPSSGLDSHHIYQRGSEHKKTRIFPELKSLQLCDQRWLIRDKER